MLPYRLSVRVEDVMQVLSEDVNGYRVTDPVVQNYARHAVQATLDPEDSAPWILLPAHLVSSLSRYRSRSHVLGVLGEFAVPGAD